MSDKARVLHIITNLELGGAQKYALSTVAQLNPERFRAYFISSPRGGLYPEARALGHVTVRFVSFLRRPIDVYNDARALLFLAGYMRRERIAVVHTHSSKAGIIGRWAAKIAGVPVIVHTVHGWSFHRHLNFWEKYFYIFLERITARITDALIVVSESDRQKGLRHNIGTAAGYSLIRYGIDREKSVRTAGKGKKKEELGIAGSTPVIGMIACLKPQKNPLDFLKAAALIIKTHPEAQFIIAGDGVLRPKAERFIRREKLAGNVKLLGWRKDIPELLEVFDIVALTSLWEGLPIALIEAMSAAKPIAAYGVDGVPEIVRDGVNGYLVAPGRVRLLAGRITRMLEDPPAAAEMGRRGKAFVGRTESFDESQMMRGIERLYARLLARKQIIFGQASPAIH